MTPSATAAHKAAGDSLSELLVRARHATPADRIAYRDRIAEHGADAIPALAPWLQDALLRSFAIRTIAAVGLDGHRELAIEALRTVGAQAPSHILRDTDEALSNLGGRRIVSVPIGSVPNPTDINEELYEFLRGAARRRQTVTYTQAGEVVGLTMRSPYHRKLLGQMLGAISENETLQGRPMLSSIVVHKGSKTLGTGFYQLGEELRHKSVGEDEGTFASRELLRTFEYWANDSDGRAGPTRTGAPD